MLTYLGIFGSQNKLFYGFELIFIAILFVLLNCFIYRLFKRNTIRITTLVGTIVALCAFTFGFIIFATLICLGLAVFLTISSSVNSAIFHKYLANQANETNKKKDIQQSDEFIEKVIQTVLNLSNKKYGAIMCFERTQSLDSYCINGTILNSPFVPELVETIFYEGSRLHDGAIIVKNELIHAASVFLPTTSLAPSGKVGARHRAAMGITEVSDCIVVVVSEETGRITLNYNSCTEHLTSLEFPNYFRNIMKKSVNTEIQNDNTSLNKHDEK